MNIKAPSRAQVVGALLGVSIIAFVGGIAGWYFASDTAQKDYLTNILLSFCAGLSVSLVFTLMIQNILSRQSSIEMFKHQQISTAVGLYERFHSPEMIEIRCRVDRLFSSLEGAEVSLGDIHRNLYLNSEDPEKSRDWVALSSLIHFYENLADLIERGLVDRDVAAINFKKYFRWLRNEPAFIAAVELSRTKREDWFFVSRFDYLEMDAGF